jgi:hypothetical protein
VRTRSSPPTPPGAKGRKLGPLHLGGAIQSDEAGIDLAILCAVVVIDDVDIEARADAIHWWRIIDGDERVSTHQDHRAPVVVATEAG